jgi:hypothetical protein
VRGNPIQTVKQGHTPLRGFPRPRQALREGF